MSTARAGILAAVDGGNGAGPSIPVWVTTPNPPDGEVGIAYNYSLAQHLNTTTGVVITLTDGPLPSGLSIVGLNITGTPDTEETQSGIRLTATNVSGSDLSNTFNIEITSIIQPSGDVTVTDPLGLSVGQNIAWSFGEPPPSGGAKQHTPEHYIRIQGNSTAFDQVAYEAEIFTKLGNQVEGNLPTYNGGHIGFAWGAVNTAPGVYSFGFIDRVRDWHAARGLKFAIQLQYKSFHNVTTKMWEMPADILGGTSSGARIAKAGFTADIWEEAAMDRYIETFIAIADRYDNDEALEWVVPTETAPSFGGIDTTGYGYTTAKLDTQLKRLYTECAAAFTNTHWMAMINSLGGEKADNKIPGLMEKCYDLRIGIGGPDSQESTPAFRNFRGVSTDFPESPPAARDYRKQLANMMVISNQVLNRVAPNDVIDLLQEQQSTHYSWIGGHGTYNANAIVGFINADPNVNTDCPTRMLGCALGKP